MSVLAVQAPTAATDWTGLNHKAAGFTTLTSDTDPVTGTVSIVFSGLEVRLSDVLAQAAGKPVSGVTIYADTLTADVDAVSAESLIVVARSVDVSALDDGLLQITAPASGEVVAEWLVGASLNGALTIASSTAAGDAVPQRVPAGTDPLRALLCQFSADGTANSQTLTDAASLTDLTGRAWALGSLRASCTAGAQLMTSRSADDRAVAQSMFSWIVSCVGALALDGGTVPADAVELYNQAGALLVTLDVAPGGFFVPVLSGQVYETEIGALLGALAGYEAGLDTLATRTDIAAAVASVSSTLQVTASAELAPLQTQLQNVRDNVASLYLGFAELRSDFALQADQSNTDYLHLAATVKNAEMAQFVQDAISTAMSVVSLGVAVAKGSQGDVGSVTDGMNSLSAGVTSGIQVLDDLAMVPPGGEGLVAQAKQLMQMQLALMTSFQSATILWSQSQDGTGGSPLPSSLGVVDIDPSLAWENFLAQAQATLTTVKEHIGSGAGSQAAQDAANAYLASLQILAGYGKAIDGKFAAYSSQTAQATLLSAQL
ncbi:MAG: hypothetical protein QOJ85_3143, partial [Solirubrobacteraceae bacterium]|nr:hypothetical protein [Solirubrobacteraceae bacterium]